MKELDENMMYLPDILEHLQADQVNADVVHVLPLIVASAMAGVMIWTGKKTRLGMRMSTTTEIITYLNDKDLNGYEDWVENQDQGSGSWMKDEGCRMKDEG